MIYAWADQDPDLISVVRELFEEYQRELGIDLCFQGFPAELANLPGKYGPPGGGLLLVFGNGVAAACGALRDLGNGTCEIKRIYVRPASRRQGIARQITEKLIEQARVIGYSMVRLDTLRRLPGTVALYQSLGFEEIAPYNVNPEPDVIYMERALA